MQTTAVEPARDLSGAAINEKPAKDESGRLLAAVLNLVPP